MRFTILCLLFAVLASCTTTPSTNSILTKDELDSLWLPTSWVDQRVSAAEKRMQQDSAGKKVWQSIEAHGGLRRWFENGALQFRFDYQPQNGGTRRNTFQTVDQWSARSVHELGKGKEKVLFGWDGKQAWVSPDTAEIDINPRFWSTTPFYFVGLPFVLADEGINHELLDPQTLEGKDYDLVKITYADGIGDAPDDFYVIYIDQETKLMGALRYIVSYPGHYPDGGHSDEKIMKIIGLSGIEGIQIPTGYHTYWWKEGVGEHITNIYVTEVKFDRAVSLLSFEKPENARVAGGVLKIITCYKRK